MDIHQLELQVTKVTRAILHRTKYGTSPLRRVLTDRSDAPQVIQVIADYREPHGAMLGIQGTAVEWLKVSADDVAEALATSLHEIETGEFRQMALPGHRPIWVDLKAEDGWMILAEELPWNI
ncbi:hypothetical protein [Gemmatimonas sp.]|jgi:hypothetical protein|uniref:hypothetical protein n=1 Tax=Gemmatimonas sp. TaxID=1962908 RepID=UPI00391F8B14